jgi:4-hydroxy-4-methyl-2-oxoglutarate aldolase
MNMTIMKTTLMRSQLLTVRGLSTKIPSALLSELRRLDTACLCDADKSIVAQTLLINSPNEAKEYKKLKVLDGSIRPLNVPKKTIAGIARTVCTKPNDFLAVLRGLDEATTDEVLVVCTKGSTKAVAGEIFCAEAERKGLAGIIIDGPMRDTTYLSQFSVKCYSSSVTPYSGTIDSPGEMQVGIRVGEKTVLPGDVIVADDDGIIAASTETFEKILPIAKSIQDIENKVQKAISEGKGVSGLTNLKEHLDKRLKGEDSNLEFRV